MERIENIAFPGTASALETVYFLNGEEAWNAIVVENDQEYEIEHTEEGDILSLGNGNEALTNAAVVFTFAKGDVDLDGHVTPADARLILRDVVGLDVASTVRGDMDGDEMLTAADARLLMRVSTFLEDPALLECATPVNPTFAEFEGGADKIMAEAAIEDDTLMLTLRANDFAGTTDGEMYIGYDAEKLEYVSSSVELDGADADFEDRSAVTQVNPQEGLFTFAFYYQGQAAAEETAWRRRKNGCVPRRISWKRK